MKHKKGITRIGLIVTILTIVFVLWAGNNLRWKLRSMGCGMASGANLKGLGNALNVYAFDYNDKFPVQGAATHTWGPTTTGWDNPKKNWTDTEGTVTIAASLYLLVREADVGPKSFVHPKPRRKPKFKYRKLKASETPFKNKTPHDMTELWDFGPDPKKHVSYSYQFPYGKHPADGISNPGNAIIADKNPWTDPLLTASGIKKETQDTFIDKVALIDFTSTTTFHHQIGNSAAHDRQGQNVLFGDNSVRFKKRPDVGVECDNIYTIGGKTETQRRIGTPPTSTKPDAANPEDSLLMNDR